MEERGKSASKRKHFDYMFKMVLIGDTCVGKSCVLTRFADDNFSENHVTTIGVDFRFKSLEINGYSIKLQIWDTAGQERYKTITNSYYRGAEGIIVVFDLWNRESFSNVKTWLEEAQKHADENTEVMILGNKSDMAGSRQVSDEDINKFKSETAMMFNSDMTIVEWSAKEGTNIELGFTQMAKKLMINKMAMESDSDDERDAYRAGSQGTKLSNMSPQKEYMAGESCWGS